MAIRNNPFNMTFDEIGEQNVPIEDEVLQLETLRKYVRHLLNETTDQDFLSSVEDLWDEWSGVQKAIPTETVVEPEFGYWWDEEKQDHDQKWKDVKRKVQVTKGEDKPSFTEENPEHYDVRHPASRRVKYGQTQKEIDVERKMMALWQEHADIDFFKSNKISYTHNVIYKSAARGMGDDGINISDPGGTQWIDAQETPQKDAISVSATYNPSGKVTVGSQSMMGKGWGFLIDGWPIFASFRDVGSQTQRMASDKAKKYYKSSGLPKRAGMPQAATKKWTDREMRMRTKRLKRKKKSEEDIDQWFKTQANSIILNEKDIQDRGTNSLDEVILDNWTISAWYIADIHQAKKFFQKAFREGTLTKPIYLLEKSWAGDNTQQVFDPKKNDDIQTLLDIFNKEEF